MEVEVWEVSKKYEIRKAMRLDLITTTEGRGRKELRTEPLGSPMSTDTHKGE